VETNVFVNCGPNSIITPPADWMPPYPYTLDPVSQVPELVMLWSGVGVLDFSDPPPPLTFATWIEGSGVPAGQRGAMDDPDGDGLSNLLEFALGGNPMQADAALVSLLEWPVADEFYLALAYTRRKAIGDLNLSVQVAPTLEFATELGSVEVATLSKGADFEEVVTRSAVPMSASPGQFMRLTVTQP
jgi:hypothetical protein